MDICDAEMGFPLETFGRYQFIYPPISSSFVSIIYNLYKWFVVLLYGHGELERIMVENNSGFARTVQIGLVCSCRSMW